MSSHVSENSSTAITLDFWHHETYLSNCLLIHKEGKPMSDFTNF